jgi:hypothetical protein
VEKTENSLSGKFELKFFYIAPMNWLLIGGSLAGLYYYFNRVGKALDNLKIIPKGLKVNLLNRSIDVRLQIISEIPNNIPLKRIVGNIALDNQIIATFDQNQESIIKPGTTEITIPTRLKIMTLFSLSQFPKELLVNYTIETFVGNFTDRKLFPVTLDTLFGAARPAMEPRKTNQVKKLPANFSRTNQAQGNASN